MPNEPSSVVVTYSTDAGRRSLGQRCATDRPPMRRVTLRRPDSCSASTRIGAMPVPPATSNRFRVDRWITNDEPSGPRRSSRSPSRREAIHPPPEPSALTMSSISPAARSMRLNEYGRRSNGSKERPGRTWTNCPARAWPAIPGAEIRSTVPSCPISSVATTRPSSRITTEVRRRRYSRPDPRAGSRANRGASRAPGPPP